MYVTIRSYTGGDEFTDALAANQDAIRELITAIDGFRAYYLVRTDGGATSISVFDDAAGAEESTRAAAAWVAENAADVAPGPPTVSGGDVAIGF